MPSRSNRASVRRRFFFVSLSSPTAFLTFHRFPSIRPHIAACAHSGGYRVQGLQGDNTGVQVEDTDVVCQPQRQEQPWPTPKRDGRRYPRTDVCKNDQPGLSSCSQTNSGKKNVAETFGLDVCYRKWPLRNAKRLMRRLRKTICSCRSARPTSRRKRTPSSVAGASR